MNRTDLFRKEAIEHQGSRLFGEVNLAAPVSSWVVTGLILTIVAGVLLGLVFGTYTRKETVTGWLTPNNGLVRVVAPDLATVEQIAVSEGEHVNAGAPLITLAFNASLSEGGQPVELELQELGKQIDELEARRELTKMKFAQDLRLAELQRNSAANELTQLNLQLASLNDRRIVAEKLLERYEALRSEDASSDLEVAVQLQNLLTLRQSFAQMNQLIVAKTGELQEAAAKLERLPVEEQSAFSELREALSLLNRQKTQLRVQRKIVLSAPVAGRVAALPIRVGESVNPQSLLITLLPEGGRLQAELFVPTRAAGFIRDGQTVFLQYDAFPYQQYGFARGEVASISRTIFASEELPIRISLTEPVYRVVVELDLQSGTTARRELPSLQAGMTLRADIIQGRQSIISMALAPLQRFRGASG